MSRSFHCLADYGDRSCSLSVELVTSLSQLPTARLAALTTGRSYYVSPAWLASVEAIRRGKTAYIVCRSAREQVLGVLPVYWGTSGRGFYNPYEMFLKPSCGQFQRSAWSPTYVVGSRFAYDCEFLLDPVAPPDMKNAILSSMLSAATRHARSVGASSLSALYLNDRGQHQLAELVGADQLFVAAANAVLTLTATTFEDYAQSLGRKRAVSIRHERNLFLAAGYEIRGSRLSEVITQTARLFAALERRHGHEGSAETEASELRLIAKSCDADSHVLIAYRQGQPVGAVLLLVTDNTVYVRSTGFDYDLAGVAFEYFNLVYYEVVAFALTRGLKRIEFGVTAYQAKLARGARLSPLLGYVESWSAPPPTDNVDFIAWTARRRAAIAGGNVDLLRRCGLI